MITQGFDFIAFLAALCGVLFWLEQKYPCKFFKILPSVILVMFLSMIFYTLGLWEMTDSVKLARASVRDNLIPAMLFLMSLSFNLTILKKLGLKLILLMIGSTVSVVIGFIVVHLIMRGQLGSETPQTFGVMAAGWTGGTQNFVALKEALSVTDDQMSYTLLMGAFCYTIWLIVIVGLKSFRTPLNRLLRADNKALDEVVEKLNQVDNKQALMNLSSLMLMFGLSLFVSSISLHAGTWLSALIGLTPIVITIIIATLIGAIFAHTKMRLMPSIQEISTLYLYIIVALIGSEVNLSALSKAPIYVLCGFMILAIHAIILLILGRLLRVDAYMVGLASIASIGSSSSATVVAATYDRSYVTIGLLMAIIGSLIGSFAGLLVHQILINI